MLVEWIRVQRIFLYIMKVYIVTTEPFPNGLAATGRIKCYAKALISEGVDVEVVNFHRTEV